MIEVVYSGRLANNLIQYSLGWILAKRLGYALKAPAIPGFPSTDRAVPGADYSDSPNKVALSHHRIDIEKIVNDTAPRHIILNGYFERYEYFREHRRDLIAWLRMDRMPVNPRDAVLHLRRTDFVDLGQALPFSYYQTAIEAVSFDRLWISTDDPRDPFLKRFKKYAPIIGLSSGRGAAEDFKHIASYKNIILSNSSYGWLAAFLSDADHVVMPKPLTGWWSDLCPNLDLLVDDDPRYQIIPCRDVYRPSFAERLYQQKRILTGRISRVFMHRAQSR